MESVIDGLRGKQSGISGKQSGLFGKRQMRKINRQGERKAFKWMVLLESETGKEGIGKGGVHWVERRTS